MYIRMKKMFNNLMSNRFVLIGLTKNCNEVEDNKISLLEFKYSFIITLNEFRSGIFSKTIKIKALTFSYFIIQNLY